MIAKIKNKILKVTFVYGGLISGPLFFLLTAFTNAPGDDLSKNAWLVIGMIVWMSIWWVTEAVPIPLAAIIPIVIIPLFGIDSMAAATASYSNPLIYLFLGGFLISIAMEKWDLHKRIALICLLFSGRKPSQQMFGLMVVTAFLSMWMSNTATAVMMLPIALSIINLRKDQASSDKPFARSILLAIAYSASIGGVATLIGSPPNALLAGYLANTHGISIGFSQWMMIGLPLSVVMLLIAWVLLTKVLYKVDTDQNIPMIKQTLRKELDKLGKVSIAEKVVLFVFLLAAILWVFRPIIEQIFNFPLNDTMIALFAASLLFVIPINLRKNTKVLGWNDTKELPWGVLLLFGGGLTLADQIQKTGIADLIASQIAGMGITNVLLLMVLVVTVVVFLTEVTSNTATAAGFLPLLGPIALTLGAGNLATILIPAVLATSFAFMMPVATPPNSIVFASGELKIKDMVTTGFWLNIVAIILIVITGLTIIPLVFDF